MKHIIDTDELEALPKYWSSVHKCYMVRVEDVSALIASSPQADGMANSRDMFEQFATLHKMSILKVGEAYSNDETNYAWWVWQKALSISSDANYAGLIKQAVNRFLGWKLPSDFNPDGNINFYRQYEYNSPYYPIGTNLFTAEQAKAMFEYCLSAYKPQADDVPPDVYDIVVDTGDGIYHTAEVVHFQQRGSKRMIQVRLGEPQSDDERKDAERWRKLKQIAMPCYLVANNAPACELPYVVVTHDSWDAFDQAIDKARE